MPSPRSIDDVGLRVVPRSVRRVGGRLLRRTRAELDWHRSRSGHADVALFHEFAPAPSGGGHQFLRALTHELDGRGLAVELNRISGRTPACLFNSFNFDFQRLRRFSARGARMVHRVDGPIGAYRGFDDGTDERIARINAELASATILQSRFSLEKHRELGIELRDPVVVPNAVDATIFHPPTVREPFDGRRMRVVADQLVRQPPEGCRGAPCIGRDGRPEAVRADVRRSLAGRSHGLEDRRPLDLGGARGTPPRPGRVRRPEPRRSVLERAPGSPRLRPARGVSR